VLVLDGPSQDGSYEGELVRRKPQDPLTRTAEARL
jgi:hypothetical protein